MIAEAREIVSAYGMSSGVQCPYCGCKTFPQYEVDTCQLCGNEFAVPKNYSHRSYKGGRRMDIDELIKKLQQINKDYGHDPEICHPRKDNALLEFIDDETVTKEFKTGSLWYA